jgi:hypothetical protein
MRVVIVISVVVLIILVFVVDLFVNVARAFQNVDPKSYYLRMTKWKCQ